MRGKRHRQTFTGGVHEETEVQDPEVEVALQLQHLALVDQGGEGASRTM